MKIMVGQGEGVTVGVGVGVSVGIGVSVSVGVGVAEGTVVRVAVGLAEGTVVPVAAGLAEGSAVLVAAACPSLSGVLTGVAVFELTLLESVSVGALWVVGILVGSLMGEGVRRAAAGAGAACAPLSGVATVAVGPMPATVIGSLAVSSPITPRIASR